MKWLENYATANPVAYSILLVSLVAVVGLGFASIKIRGVGLGVTGVLFAGLIFGHFGFHLEHHTMEFLREFGLILFVFTIGLQIGPGFFASLRDEHRSGGRTPAPEAGCSPRCPQGRGESNGSQDCRDILNAVPKRNPMIVPTMPVRKITSACDIWTDQTRYRTSTTVEFCIAKMMPNRSRIPPRISLNLVVMVSCFSLSSWRSRPAQ